MDIWWGGVWEIGGGEGVWEGEWERVVGREEGEGGGFVWEGGLVLFLVV